MLSEADSPHEQRTSRYVPAAQVARVTSAPVHVLAPPHPSCIDHPTMWLPLP